MDNKKISTILGTVLIIIFSATTLAFVLVYENKHRVNEVRSNSMKVVKNDKAENTQEEQLQSVKVITEDINFCKMSYRTNGFNIGGINVLKNIADILNEKKYENICQNYRINTKNGDTLNIEPYKDQDENTYIDIFVYKYKIDTTNNIYILNGFDGSPELIGKLK